jgi:TolB-like protein
LIACYPNSDFEHRYPIGIGRERSSGWGERSSLALLPLFLVGTVTDDQGLGLGFADALVSRLGNLRGVDILPTSSVLNVPTEATASDIASRLGVRVVVHGAIREFKGELRVSLEMFDTHLQSPCFTRKCDLDVNRLSYLEDEIAKQIAGALSRPLRLPEVQRRPGTARTR